MWSFALGGQFGFQQTALPGLPVGGGPFIEVRRDGTGPLAPALRLALLAAGSGTEETNRGRVELTLHLVRLTACPVRLPSASVFALRPCALLESGRLSGSGAGTDDPDSADVAWWGAGSALRGEARLRSWFTVELEAGAVFPLIRDRFVFGPEPARVGYAVPAVAGTFSAGLQFQL
jgi:hypothetical protein